MAILGVDISHFNSAVDWQALQQRGIAFAYAKAVIEPTYGVDAQYVRNTAQAKAHGILIGPYLFHRPDVTPKRQVDAFLKVYPHWHPGDMPPCLDVEDITHIGGMTPNRISAHVKECLNRIEDGTGRNPLLYTYKWYLAHNLRNGAPFAGIYPLWIAQYTQPGPGIPYIGQFPTWSVWQNSAPGTAGPDYNHMDHNIWHGDIAGLRRFAGL